MIRRLALVSCLVLAASAAARAAQPQFWRIEGARDFLDGTIEGLSVDSEGRVRLAPVTQPLYDPEVPFVWCLTRDPKGTLYAGTGNDGKVFKIEGGKGTSFFDAAELEVHALAVGPDGKLYVGTSPDGKVYAVDAAGKAQTFYDPNDKYVWALVFDHAGNLLVATGGDGKIHRVDKQGKAQILFTSPETHITALVLDPAGNIYAGSAPSGILYRIDPSGKVFVLHDSPYREVKALDLGKDGSLYAAVVDGKEREDTRPPVPLPPAPPSATPTAEVTVTENFAVIAPQAGAPGPIPTPRPSDVMRGGAPKGAVLRVLPSGEVDTLWSSSDETPHALVVTSDGVLVGTGNKGKIYRIHNDRTWAMLSSFPADQVTALFRGAGDSVAVATSNPGKVHALEPAAGARGSFVSKVKDTDTVSAWGQIRWEANAPAGAQIELQTRSGNTASPDSTWSDWSAVHVRAGGEPIASERARFLQVKSTLIGKEGASPVLDSITAAYLQRNLRPQIASITVHPPGEVFQKPLSISGETEILGLDAGPAPDRPGATSRGPMPPATSYSRKLYQRGIQTFSWKGEDPNGDSLIYEVSYRRINDTRWRLLRKGLTDAVLAWDTTTVPNGRYLIRVTANDSPSNPESLALSSEKESDPFDVDNTPPTVSLILVPPSTVRALVRDDSSLVRKAEYSVDGGRWQEVHPVDGINDEMEETYEISVANLGSAGPHVVVVRGTDLLGNASTARIEVP
jgi:sugar lactone lactonase YvrE